MKQKFLALVCVLSLLLGATPAAALTGESARAADTLATLGLVTGDYGLDSPATRAQAAVLTVRLAAAQQAAAADNWNAGFRDLPAWAADEINYAARQKWVSGVTAIDFKPNQTVTANGFCTMLLRMLGYSDKAGDFTAADAALFARTIGLLPADYEGGLTRGDLFEIALAALTFPYQDSGERVIDRLVSGGAVPTAAANALGLLTETLTPRQAADRHMAAVFCLDGYEKQLNVDAQEPSSNASGFFISADGLAVTNYHSIENEVYAVATAVNGQQYPVEKVVWYDKDVDIAVIQISKTSLQKKTTSSFAHLEMAGTAGIRPGDVVHTISNPLGLGLSVTTGVISATAREVERYALPCIVSTADISQGSSGGVLLNAYGQAIGVTSGAFVYGNSMYLAVPVDPVLTADLTGPGWTLAEVAQREADAA